MKKLLLSLVLMFVATLTASAKLITTEGVKPTKGDGSSDAPYEIWTAEELRWFVHYENTRVWFPDDDAKLMCDIDLSSICGPDKGSWIPLGYDEKSSAVGHFDGTFDGNGFTVSGLYIDGKDFSSDAAIGFVGVYYKGCFHDVTVEGEIVNPTKYTGGIIAHDKYTGLVPESFYQCVSKVKISGNVATGSYVGGVVGYVFQYQHSHLIDRLMYDGDMSGLTGDLQNVGGIYGFVANDQRLKLGNFVSNTRAGLPMIGKYMVVKDEQINAVTIFECISDGSIFGYLASGKNKTLYSPVLSKVLYCGNQLYEKKDDNVTFSEPKNCYKIMREDLASGKACYDMSDMATNRFGQNLDQDRDAVPYIPQLDHPQVYYVRNYTDCVTYIMTYNNTGQNNLGSMPHKYIEGQVFCEMCGMAVNPDYHTAREGDYYLLGNADDVKWFWTLVNKNGVTNAKARLTADIDMEGLYMQPLAVFSGEIDGQGHTLDNICITSQGEYGGMVGKLKSGGSIHDLTIGGSVRASCYYYLGGFAGYVEKGAQLYNLRNDCTITGFNYGFITSPFFLGGIAGYVGGNLHYCINNGPVVDQSSATNSFPLYIAGVAGRIGQGSTFSYLINNAVVGSQGIYKIIGSAVANHSATPVGLYYVEVDNPGINYFFGKTASTGATAINDRKEVGNGQLCYMLNHTGDSETLTFGQTIGTDYVPYPGVSDAHKRVYNYKRYYNCTNYYNYSNHPYDGAPADSHEFGSDGYCTLCYHADVPQSDDIYQIATPEHWNKYAKAINAAYSNGALGCFASAALTADITLNASTFTQVGNLWGNIHGNGHTVTFSNDPGKAYALIKNVGGTATVSDLNVQFTGSSNSIVADNKGKVTACAATGGQIYAENYGVVTDCYADRAFGIAATGYLLRCLQCVETNGEKQYTVLTKSNGTAECSVKEVFSQAQQETGELAYYISHLDKNQPCVWGEALGTDSHPKPYYGQTPASDTYVTSLTTYSAEHPDGIVEYMNAGVALEAAPGYYKVCKDTESWTALPEYNFIVDNGDGTYTAEHINIDPTVQNYLPIAVQADKLTFQSADDEGKLAAKDYGFGEILSLIFPVAMPVSNVNGHVHLFDGYDALNNTLVFTSSLDEGDCTIPANTPVLVKTYGGGLLNADLTNVTVSPMTEAGVSELENVRHLTNYQQQTLPTDKTIEDGEYVLYYVLNGDKALLTTADANTVGEFNAYFRLPYIANSVTQSEINVALVEDRELKTSRIVERDLFSIPYGAIDDNAEWQKVSHLSDKNVFYGNDINKDIYANISAYDFLYIHGKAGQKYQFYFNGSDATEVEIDSDGDAFIDLDEHRVGIGDVYLRGIRLAEGETVADDAFAKVYKYLEEGLVLYGYGDFSDDLKGYPFYDATGVKCGITLNLDNPNAMVVGGSNVKGVYNRIVKSEDVMQGFTAEKLRLTDGGDFCYDYSVKCPQVTFTRYDVPAEMRYVTFVLPFAAKYVKGMHEYIDCDGENVYFNTPEDGVIDAYLPIVIDMEEYEGSTITIIGEDFVALSPNGTFNVAPVPSTKYDLKYGFVKKEQQNVPLTNAEVANYNVYAFSTNSYQFVRATDTFSISPFRAFFMLPKNTAATRTRGEVAPEYEAEALDIVLDGKEIEANATGIESLNTEDAGNANTYNILGMPVGADYRGFVIKNNQKIIIK